MEWVYILVYIYIYYIFLLLLLFILCVVVEYAKIPLFCGGGGGVCLIYMFLCFDCKQQMPGPSLCSWKKSTQIPVTGDALVDLHLYGWHVL